MGNITIDYFPPLYWQEFEMITADICKKKWKDDYVTRYGREGQAQNGIDIFGFDFINSKNTAVQCKRRRNVGSYGQILAGGVLTEETIKSELKKVNNCSFTVDN